MVIYGLYSLPTRTVVLVTADRHVRAVRATGSYRAIGGTGLVTGLVRWVIDRIGIALAMNLAGFGWAHQSITNRHDAGREAAGSITSSLFTIQRHPLQPLRSGHHPESH